MPPDPPLTVHKLLWNDVMRGPPGTGDPVPPGLVLCYTPASLPCMACLGAGKIRRVEQVADRKGRAIPTTSFVDCPSCEGKGQILRY